jgi:Fe-S-cluster containining protein
MPKYECDQCGACCQGHLIVQAEDLDVLREPRLLEADPHYANKTADTAVAELQDDFFHVVMLACDSSHPCPFLGTANHCSIYPTRPNDCVAMQAGDEQCQQARAAAGLPPLQSIEEQQQAKYRQAYIEQIRRQQCPGCGDTDLL